MPTPIFFNQLLISMNLYQNAKNRGFLSVLHRGIVDLKMLQPDWPIAFWNVSYKPDFSQIWDLSKNTANIKNFTIEQIQKKIKD